MQESDPNAGDVGQGFSPSFRVTMMLCDHAQVAGGKIFISGGGWSVTPTPTLPSAIALLLQVPWGEANRRVRFTLRLIDADGAPVTQVGPVGQHIPIEVGGELEVGRPPGLPEGSMLDAPLAVNIQPLVLDRGRRYVWKLEINGKTSSDWEVVFLTR